MIERVIERATTDQHILKIRLTQNLYYTDKGFLGIQDPVTYCNKRSGFEPGQYNTSQSINAPEMFMRCGSGLFVAVGNFNIYDILLRTRYIHFIFFKVL